ncbi:MAG: hypothetical protein WC107_01165 [Patescibacteria group bacterium]
MFRKIIDGYKNHPVQNSLIVLLLLVMGFLSYEVIDSKDSGNTVNNKSSVVLLNGSKDNYFIPTEESPGTSSDTKKTANTTSTTKYDLGSLVDNLYNFSGSSKLNAKTGIVSTSGSKSSSFMVKHIMAQDKQPVVFYINYIEGGIAGYHQIWQKNTLTGEKQLVVQENTLISSLDFNQAQDSIVYAKYHTETVDGNTIGGNNYDIVLFNLSSKTKKIIAENLSGSSSGTSPKWSPDGKFFAYAEMLDSQTNPKLKIEFYDVVQEKLIPIDVPDTYRWSSAGNNMVWDETSTSVAFGTWNNLPGGHMAQNSVTQVALGGNVTSTTIKDGKFNLLYPALVNNMVFGITSDYDHTCMRQCGWLASFNKATKELKEYKTASIGNADIEDVSVRDWIVNSKADKIVFSTDTFGKGETGLKVLDLAAGTSKDLEFPGSFFAIIGWNGNENNVLLWDNHSSFYNVNINSGKMTKITD